MLKIIPRVNILGVPFSIMGMDETVKVCESIIESYSSVDNDNSVGTAGGSGGCHIITANPEIVMTAQKDVKLMEILNKAEIVTCDGTGIVWASRYTDFPATERVAGFDLMLRLLNLCEKNEYSVYFIGAKPEIMELAIENIREKWPLLVIAGYQHGYYQAEDEKKIVEDIAAKKPTILFVALGAPRQEYFIAEYLAESGVSIALGVGGSLDVLSGKVKRAPMFWQRLHLEWLYRLVMQPSRWRRALAIPRFIFNVLKSKKSIGNTVK